jgi:hypothetical protein
VVTNISSHRRMVVSTPLNVNPSSSSV